jgi:hypothetical protein
MKTKTCFAAFLLCAVSNTHGQLEWYNTNLSEAKQSMGVAVLGSKVYFAGGNNVSNCLATVEIFDVKTQEWDNSHNLSVPRENPAGVSCGSKVFFAGGMNYNLGVTYSTIDIYDTVTGEWTYVSLSVPRFLISAVSYGNKVLFAGGISFPWVTHNQVDIYDLETDMWTTEYLSQTRGGIAGAVVGDLAIFAGGTISEHINSDRVDIYNFTTGEWSIDSLSLARSNASATTSGYKVVVAGGYYNDWTSSDQVDIYDYLTGTWSTENLSYPRCSGGNAATVNDSACFVGGGDFYYGFFNPSIVIDIFDESNNSWSTDFLPLFPLINHSVTAVKTNSVDYLIVAGGQNETGTVVSTVSITGYYNDVRSVGSQRSAVSCYPNPTSGIVDFRFSMVDFRGVSLKVYDAHGREVAKVQDGRWPGDQVVRWDAGAMPAGIYYYRLTTDDQRLTTGKIVKY